MPFEDENHVIVTGREFPDDAPADRSSVGRERKSGNVFLDVVWWSEPLFAPRTTWRITHIAVEYLAD